MLLSYKNFEHMVTHCMEQDGTRVTMSKRLIGSVLSAILNCQSRVALQRPPSNDALIKALKGAEPATFTAMKGLDEREKINLKLKTRLLLPNLAETNPKQLDNPAALMASFVRCNSCNATLLQEIAVQNYDESVVLPQYEPLDKEALVSQYSEILRMVGKIRQEVKKSKEESNTGQDGDEEESKGPDLAGAEALAEFMEETATAARRAQEYKISDSI